MYDPTTMELKRAILEGKVGSVEGMKCRVAWPRDSAYYSRNNWAGRLRIGDTWVLDSPMNNAVAHDLMMMLFLAGPTEQKAATPLCVEAELYRANNIESSDTACIRVQTDTGIPLLFYSTHACSRSFGPEVHASGTAGTIVWTHDAAVIERPEGGKQKLDKLSINPLRKHMIHSVLDVAGGGTSFYCDLDVASKQTIVVNAVHQACEIHTVASEQVTLDSGVVIRTIPRIEEAIDSAFEKETLLYESGLPWALPSGSLDCTDYRIFQNDHEGA